MTRLSLLPSAPYSNLNTRSAQVETHIYCMSTAATTPLRFSYGLLRFLQFHKHTKEIFDTFLFRNVL